MLPNIIYIHSHDTGRCVEFLDGRFRTPSLVRLAESSLVFRNAHTCSPTCTPSRVALLTGQYPHRTGVFGLAHLGFPLTAPHRHLAWFLKSLGYRTALSGIQHETESAAWSHLGYEEKLSDGYLNSGADHANAAINFLKQTHERPFFLSVGFYETHRAFAEWQGVVDPDRLLPLKGLPDVGNVREDTAGFHASLTRLDDHIGRILDAIDAASFRENTLVICTTDHGPPFPGMKCQLSGAGTGVFLLVSAPWLGHEARHSHALVSNLDLFPTICEVLRVDVPHAMDGVSLFPLFESECEVRESLFGEINYHVAFEPQRAIRTQRWNYIRRWPTYETANVDNGPTKAFFQEHRLIPVSAPEELLFDLWSDPDEKNNLARSPDHQSVRVDLAARLLTLMSDSRDPCLLGSVPGPSGSEPAFWRP